MQQRYKVKTPMEYKAFADKQRAIMKKRHGYTSPFQLESVRRKLAKNRHKSKEELSWLNNLDIPNDANHRQVYIKTKIVDGFDPVNKIIYEFLGDFWHGHPRLVKQYSMKNKKRYLVFLKERFIATKKRFDCWQSDTKISPNFYREYKGELEYETPSFHVKTGENN